MGEIDDFMDCDSSSRGTEGGEGVRYPGWMYNEDQEIETLTRCYGFLRL